MATGRQLLDSILDAASRLQNEEDGLLDLKDVWNCLSDADNALDDALECLDIDRRA